MSRKKSYNPFKMPLAWIGIIFGAVISLYMSLFQSGGYSNLFNAIKFNFGNIFAGSLIGFLIGWGINILWRKIK